MSKGRLHHVHGFLEGSIDSTKGFAMNLNIIERHFHAGDRARLENTNLHLDRIERHFLAGDRATLDLDRFERHFLVDLRHHLDVTNIILFSQVAISSGLFDAPKLAVSVVIAAAFVRNVVWKFAFLSTRTVIAGSNIRISEQAIGAASREVIGTPIFWGWIRRFYRGGRRTGKRCCLASEQTESVFIAKACLRIVV